MTPSTALTHIDDTPYCWVMLAFHSGLDDKLYKELAELANGLAEYYYERCGVGILDLAYPSNKATFSTEVYKQSPCLVVRYPDKARLMFDVTQNLASPTLGLPMNDIYSWGKIIGANELGNEPIKAFEEIDLIYKEMHTNYKLSSLYMEHYSFHPRSIKVITRDQLKQYNHWLHHQAEQAAVDEGYTYDTNEHFNEAMKFIGIQMHDWFLAANLDEKLQLAYDELVKGTSYMGNKVPLTPRLPPNIEDIIPLWLSVSMTSSDSNLIPDEL